MNVELKLFFKVTHCFALDYVLVNIGAIVFKYGVHSKSNITLKGRQTKLLVSHVCFEVIIVARRNA